MSGRTTRVLRMHCGSGRGAVTAPASQPQWGHEGEGERQRAGGWGHEGEGERQRAGGWGYEVGDHA